MTISEEYASYINHLRFETLPDEVVAKTKQLILDSIGCAIAGTSSDTRQVLSKYIPYYEAERGCSVFSFNRRYSPDVAMLSNGVMSHSYDFDDCHNASLTHPASILVACLLSLGELSKFSGRDAIAAFVGGYEIAVRLGMAATPLGQYTRGFHPTGTVGTLGAAALCGKVMGLDVEQLTNALGVAGSCASGLMEWTADGAMTKRLHSGLAARSGFLAASLAKHGFTGPKTVIEGKQGFLNAFGSVIVFDKLTLGLGKTYETLDSQIKLYACNSGFHTSIEALLRILNEHKIAAEDIEAVSAGIRTGTKLTTASDENYHSPKTILDCQMSLPFTLAVAAFDRKVSVEQYTEEKMRDKRIQELTVRIETPVKQYLVDAYEKDHRVLAVSYTHLTLPTNREV